MTRTRIRRLVAATSALAVVAVGYAAYAANADDPSYRTARATSGDLEQTLALSGTIEPISRADLAFATSGTVDEVRVQAGEKVKAGAVLGALDRSSLRESVQKARATLASARAQLESDEAAQASAVSSGSSGQAPSQGSGPTKGQQQPSAGPTSGGSQPQDNGTSAALAQLAGKQHAVTSAQTVVSASLAVANQALSAQQTACASAFSTDPSADHSGDQACSDALAAVETAQQQVDHDQQALQDAIDALTQALTAAVGGATGSTSHRASTAAATTAEKPAVVLVAAVTTADGNLGGGTVTAATIAHDQAQIDQARADLLSAQQELATATVKAPFSGRVVEVSAAEGDSVAAGTDVFVLVSQGTTTVEMSVTAAQAQQLKVGQTATATPVGSDAELEGEVSQVSTIPDSDGTYAVTITLRGRHADLPTGLTAAVTVVTGTVKDAVTVPASAVSDGRVLLLKNGTATETRVTTGVHGASSVQVTDGLAVGDTVVLADLDKAIPTSDTQNQRFGGPDGFSGPPKGAFPGGGGSLQISRGG